MEAHSDAHPMSNGPALAASLRAGLEQAGGLEHLRSKLLAADMEGQGALSSQAVQVRCELMASALSAPCKS